MGVIFVAAQLTLGYFVWKYRDQHFRTRAEYSHGNLTLEIVWTTLTAILFVGREPDRESHLGGGTFSPRGGRRYAGRSHRHAVRLVFPLSRPRRQVWKRRPELEDPPRAAKRPWARPADPASKDDVVTGIMEVPVNREVEVILRAHDVIHSFFVPGHALQAGRRARPGDSYALHSTETGRV
jgi:cytochrome c oxidase subunit II